MTLDAVVHQTSAPRRAFFQNNQQLLARLTSEGQAPEILFIGCNDSRVIPEAITGAKPGDIFVLRSLANIIPPYGTGEHAIGATLEYAVGHLKIKHIIICGHTDCGGIKALDTNVDPLHESHLARWIEYTRPAQTKVDAWGVDPKVRHLKIVQENVLFQLENLRTYDIVRQAQEANKLVLHGWVYDLSSGRISYWDANADRFLDEGEME